MGVLRVSIAAFRPQLRLGRKLARLGRVARVHDSRVASENASVVALGRPRYASRAPFQVLNTESRRLHNLMAI